MSAEELLPGKHLFIIHTLTRTSLFKDVSWPSEFGFSELLFSLYLFGGTRNSTLYLDACPDTEKAENTGQCALFPRYIAHFLAYSRCSIVPVKLTIYTSLRSLYLPIRKLVFHLRRRSLSGKRVELVFHF